MIKQSICIEAKREGYSLNQIENTMTVGELKDWLEQYDDNALVYLSHDNGYTYGGITPRDFAEDYEEVEMEGDEDNDCDTTEY